MKIRVFAVAVTLCLGALLATTPAFASSRPVASSRVVAQASPCAIGEVCEQPTVDPNATVPAIPKPKDPAGKTVRSLLTMSLMLAGFVFYLRWAMKRGTVY